MCINAVHTKLSLVFMKLNTIYLFDMFLPFHFFSEVCIYMKTSLLMHITLQIHMYTFQSNYSCLSNRTMTCKNEAVVSGKVGCKFMWNCYSYRQTTDKITCVNDMITLPLRHLQLSNLCVVLFTIRVVDPSIIVSWADRVRKKTT